jgi:photosystem II stability/assembly factor-like uncharacterized protein
MNTVFFSHRAVRMLVMWVLCVYALPSWAQSLQWQQTNGPYGGFIVSLAVKEKVLFAGSVIGGIYRSDDNGTTWTNSGLIGQIVRSIIVSDKTLFVGTDDGMYRSMDNGATWINLQVSSSKVSIRVLALQGTTLFAGTEGKGIYRSMDNGTTWTILSLPTTATIQAFAFSGTTVFVGTQASGIFRSSDNGATWETINIINKNVLSLVMHGSTLIAGTSSNSFRSSDNGATWVASSFYTSFRSLTVYDGFIMAGTNKGVFLSTDSGVTWSPRSLHSLLDRMSVRAIVISGQSIFAASYGGGIYRSIDYGWTWAACNQGLSNTFIVSFTEINNELLTGTYNGIYKFSNDGTSWQPIIADSIFPASYSLVTSVGSTVFASVENRIFRSNDKGKTWIETNYFERESVYSFVKVDTTLFTGTLRGIYSTVNGGETWQASGLSEQTIYALANIVGSGILAGTSGGLYRSMNNGMSWVKVNGDLANFTVLSFVKNGTMIFAGTQGGGVFRSTDNGNTWIVANNDLITSTVNSFAVSGTVLFAGTSGGVFRSIDNGTTWAAVNTGLTNFTVQSLVVSGSTLFAGTQGGGVFRASITTSVQQQPAPEAASLLPPTPNPTTDNLRCSYVLRSRGAIDLALVDVLGRRVATLASEVREAGDHSTTFDTRGLPAGVYSLVLRSADGSFAPAQQRVVVGR